MSKTLITESLKVLRQFQVAGELTARTAITQVRESTPRLTTRIITFLFEHTRYFIIYDTAANDDTEYLKELIKGEMPSVDGKFIRNPHDDTITYGLRYKFKEVYLFEVVPDKKRLDLELTSRYADLSRSTIQKYIKAGYVTVNGEVVTTTKRDVSSADEIALQPPEKQDTSSDTLPILYIDDDVVVINKPVGILTHSKGAMNDEFTVADFMRRYTTNALNTTRPGIVHRLDRATSGIIIGARSDEAALMLKKQFADRTVKKQYAAVVDGTPKLGEAMIDLPINRNPSAPSTFRVDVKGKPALTAYTVLASNDKHSLVELKPRTGRTHQLRVHMQYINTPITGDRVYGVSKSNSRMFLHAQSLEITLPGGKRMTFTSPVPAEFEAMTR